MIVFIGTRMMGKYLKTLIFTSVSENDFVRFVTSILLHSTVHDPSPYLKFESVPPSHCILEDDLDVSLKKRGMKEVHQTR